MPDRSLLLPCFVGQTFRYEPTDNYLYLSNAKAGCSTIKASLRVRHLEKNGEPVPETLPASMVHGRGFWTYDYELALESRPFTFSVVRNPFARVLSTYLAKIARRNPRIRPRFCQRYGFTESAKISFIQFLRSIDDPETVQDQHWRPQVQNLFIDSIPLDAVVHLEALSQSLAMLESKLGFELKVGVRNQRNPSPAAMIAEHYDEEAADIVRRVFRRDFEAFGYSEQLSEVGDAPQSGPLSFPKHDPNDLLSLRAISHLEKNDRQAAAKVLEPAVAKTGDVIQTLLYCDAALDRDNVQHIAGLLDGVASRQESDAPIARLIAASVRVRVEQLRGDDTAFKSAARELKRRSAFAAIKAPPELKQEIRRANAKRAAPRRTSRPGA